MELKFSKYDDFRIKSLFGRYITNDSILQLTEIPSYSIIGKSCNNLPIYYLKIGSGPIKILIWVTPDEKILGSSFLKKNLIFSSIFILIPKIGLKFFLTKKIARRQKSVTVKLLS